MTLFRFLPVFLCGCLVVPATTTTTRSLGTRDGQVFEGADRGLELTAEASGTEVAIRASRVRDCYREVLAVTEVTSSRHLRLGGSDDPRAQALGVLVAPVLIPISAIVSGVAVAADGGSTTEKTRVDHTVPVRCTRPAEGLAVELVAPSGTILRGKIDAHGVAVVELPATEPYHGFAIARAEGVSTKVMFERAKPAVTAVRDAVLACAADHQKTGAVRVVIAVDPAGASAGLHVDDATRTQPTPDDELTSCVGAAIAKVRFPPAQRATTVVLPLDLAPRG